MARNETEHHYAGKSATENGSSLPFLDQMPETMRSMMDTNAKLQSEFLTLWSHRAQAWLNLPKQVLSCKSPADVSAAQGAFLTTMQRHYKEYFDCVMNDALALDTGSGRTNGKTPPEPESRPSREHEAENRKAA